MINISKTLYVAKTPQPSTSILPEAEIIPAGETKKELDKLKMLSNRMNSISEIDNIPLPGFTVIEAVRRYSSSPNWKVIDPRGFIVTIDTHNISEILTVTGITEGLIQEKCIWGRHDDSTRVVLIPVNTPEYLEAIENTKILENRVEISEIKIGDTIMLTDKTVGMYCGKMSIYGKIRNSIKNSYKPRTTLRTHVMQLKDGRYLYSINESKIVSIVEKANTEINQEAIIVDMNKNTHKIISSIYYNDKSVRFISSIAHTPKLIYEEIDRNEAESTLFNARVMNDIGRLLLENDKGEKFIVDINEYFNNIGTNVETFNVCSVDISSTDRIMLLSNRHTYFNSSSGCETLDNFTKYYKIIKKVKNLTYI